MSINSKDYKKLVVRGDNISIDLNTVPKKSKLYIILTDDKKSKELDSILYFKELVRYLERGKVGVYIHELIHNLSKLNILTLKTLDYPVEFLDIKLEEEWDKHNRYNPYFEHYFRDPYFNLIKLDDYIESIIDKFNIIKAMFVVTNFKQSPYIDSLSNAGIIDINKLNKFVKKGDHYLTNLLDKFNPSVIRVNKFESECKRKTGLSWYDNLTNCLTEEISKVFGDSSSYFWKNFWNGLVLAGGSVTDVLTGSIYSNKDVGYDFFFVGMSEQNINTKITWLMYFYKSKVLRNEHSIIIDKLRFFLRSYSGMSELLHSFDIDASCFGFDGKSIYTTRRGKYAIDNMINIVDVDNIRFPLYEHRLVKYFKCRLFSIYIPNFDYRSYLTGNQLNNLNSQVTSGLKMLIKLLNSDNKVNPMLSIEIDTKNLNVFDIYSYNSHGPPSCKSDEPMSAIVGRGSKEVLNIPSKIYNQFMFSIPRKLHIIPYQQLVSKLKSLDMNKWYDGLFFDDKGVEESNNNNSKKDISFDSSSEEEVESLSEDEGTITKCKLITYKDIKYDSSSSEEDDKSISESKGISLKNKYITNEDIKYDSSSSEEDDKSISEDEGKVIKCKPISLKYDLNKN